MYYLIIATVALLPAALGVYFSRRHKRHPSANPLISSSAIVDRPLSPNGSVLINGELWLACSANGKSIPTGSRVTIVGINQHLLLVSQS
ncbi:MAG TPA: NfeD family protein [Pyrinomonadaceae bacterium]|nr:NfeD family protein [Pyrinomonadaceae bacterium]